MTTRYLRLILSNPQMRLKGTVDIKLANTLTLSMAGGGGSFWPPFADFLALLNGYKYIFEIYELSLNIKNKIYVNI